MYTTSNKQLKRGVFISLLLFLVYLIANQYNIIAISLWGYKLFIVNMVLTLAIIILNITPQIHSLLINSSVFSEENVRVKKTKADILTKLITILCISISGALILQTIGIGMELFFALGGILGVALGFAARDFLSGFIGTAIIYWDRPFIVGDMIKFNIDKNTTLEGIVEKIDWRFTVIKPKTKTTIFVPNANFITCMVENLSLNKTRTIGFIVEVYLVATQLIDKISIDLEEEFSRYLWISKDHSTSLDFDFVSVNENFFSFKILVYINYEITTNLGISIYDVKRITSNSITNYLTIYSQRFNISQINV
ncbi:mechanosensitive ion channel family protein [Lyticum sinuosum]|uniref:mechanosensitive ion channel family protein n=1 Tax=Lyticum sinuosum TaxID=1332059 RepID=UPI002ACEBF19|nr:mechanosensitive ion channel domain-containing protein [Lyticum sinuosum]